MSVPYGIRRTTVRTCRGGVCPAHVIEDGAGTRRTQKQKQQKKKKEDDIAAAVEEQKTNVQVPSTAASTASSAPLTARKQKVHDSQGTHFNQHHTSSTQKDAAFRQTNIERVTDGILEAGGSKELVVHYWSNETKKSESAMNDAAAKINTIAQTLEQLPEKRLTQTSIQELQNAYDGYLEAQESYESDCQNYEQAFTAYSEHLQKYLQAGQGQEVQEPKNESQILAESAQKVAAGDKNLWDAVYEMEQWRTREDQLEQLLTQQYLATPKDKRQAYASELEEHRAWEVRLRELAEASGISYADLQDLVKQTINAENTAHIREVSGDFGKEHPFLAMALSMGMSSLDTVSVGYTALERLAQGIFGDDGYVDTNSSIYQGSHMRDALQDGAQALVAEQYGETAGEAYRTGVRMLEDGMNSIFGKAGGSSAITAVLNQSTEAVQTYLAETERGVDPETAMNRAAIGMALGMMGETPVLDTIFHTEINGLGDVVKNGIGRGLEEVCVEALSTGLDVVLNGDRSEVYAAVDMYVRGGMTEEEAARKVIQDELGGCFTTFLYGAACGSIESAVTWGVDRMEKKWAEWEANGRKIAESGGTEDLMQKALEMPEDTAAYNLAARLEERQEDAAFQTGLGLDSEIDDLLTRNQKKDMLDQKLNEYGFTAKELGQLAELVENGESQLTITPEGDIMAETFGDDPRMYKTELDYTTTNGLHLQATPGKTTTILGSYNSDMKYIIQELGDVRSTDFSGRTGCFNVLNAPNELFSALNGKGRFWNQSNNPWLQNAIDRDDIFYLATEPTAEVLFKPDKEGNMNLLTGFGQEFYFMIGNGYVYDSLKKAMVRKWG